MRAWLERSVKWANEHSEGSRNWGNHGVCVSNGKIYFSYFATDICIVDHKNETIEVRDAGYTSGTTPQAIHQILNYYENNDYGIINMGCGNYDNWYNDKKYRVMIFDEDVTLKEHNYQEYVIPIWESVDTVPYGSTPKQFRENFVNNLRSSDVIVSTKKAVYVRSGNSTNYYNFYYCGMSYKFYDKHYKHTGSIMFCPVNKKLIKRQYLQRI